MGSQQLCSPSGTPANPNPPAHPPPPIHLNIQTQQLPLSPSASALPPLAAPPPTPTILLANFGRRLASLSRCPCPPPHIWVPTSLVWIDVNTHTHQPCKQATTLGAISPGQCSSHPPPSSCSASSAAPRSSSARATSACARCVVWRRRAAKCRAGVCALAAGALAGRIPAAAATAAQGLRSSRSRRTSAQS